MVGVRWGAGLHTTSAIVDMSVVILISEIKSGVEENYTASLVSECRFVNLW